MPELKGLQIECPLREGEPEKENAFKFASIFNPHLYSEQGRRLA